MQNLAFAGPLITEQEDIMFSDVVVEYLATDGASRRTVLGPLSIRFQSGQHVAVLGPNGAGKTTMLRLIAQLQQPSSGQINFPNNISVGFVFQKPSLFPWLNVRENICLPTSIGTGYSGGEEGICKVMAMFNLRDYAEHMPVELSGGFKARVAFARALVVRPDFLCCDEPFASLDLCGRLEIYSRLPDMMRDAGTTLLMVSHSIEEALALAGRILVFDGPPLRLICDEIVTYPISTEAQGARGERVLKALRSCRTNNNDMKL